MMCQRPLLGSLAGMGCCLNHPPLAYRKKSFPGRTEASMCESNGSGTDLEKAVAVQRKREKSTLPSGLAKRLSRDGLGNREMFRFFMIVRLKDGEWFMGLLLVYANIKKLFAESRAVAIRRSVGRKRRIFQRCGADRGIILHDSAFLGTLTHHNPDSS
jgi:hypothetical protein